MAAEKKKSGYTLADKCKDEEEKLRKELALQLSNDMKKLFTDKILTDLVIKAGNKEFRVHKIIFQEMTGDLYSEMMSLPGSCEENNVIVLDHVTDLEELKQVLCSFYTDDDISSSVEKLKRYCGKSSVYDSALDSMVTARFQNQNGESEVQLLNETSKDTISEKYEDDGSTRSLEALAEKFVEKIIAEAQKTCMLQGSCILMTENDKSTVDKADSGRLIDSSVYPAFSSDIPNDINTVEPSVCTENTGINLHSEISRVPVSEISTCELIKSELGLTLAPKACSLLGEDLLRKLARGVASDCVVSVGDWEFPAHRCMLAARSSYFAMMLNGCWMESESERIVLEGVDASVVKQMLLYIYGGVLNLDPACSIGGLVMIADMYDVAGMKNIISLMLNKDYCHFFHKPCPGCIAGVPETLPLTMMYNMPDMCEKCLRWINKHKEKVWTAKSFALLPQECLDYCTQTAVKDLNLINLIDSLLECQRLNEKIPRLKWTDSVLHCVATLMDSALEYASQNFVNVVAGREFRQLDQTSLGFNMRALEEIFSLIITSLTPGVACESFLTLHTFVTQIHNYIKQQEEKNRFKYDRFSEEYTALVEKLCKKCKEQLCLYIHQSVNTAEWFQLSQELQKEIMDEANYVCIDTPGRGRMAARPKLTSMKKRPLTSEFRVSMKEYFDKHFGPKETFPSGAVEKTKSRLSQKTEKTKKKETPVTKKETQKKPSSQAAIQKSGIGVLVQTSKQSSVRDDKTKSVVKSAVKEKTRSSDLTAAGDLKALKHDRKIYPKSTSESTSKSLSMTNKPCIDGDIKATGTKVKTLSSGDRTSSPKSVTSVSALGKSSSKRHVNSKTETGHSLFANIRKEAAVSDSETVSDESDLQISFGSANQLEEDTEVGRALPCMDTVSRRRSQSADSSSFRPHFGMAPTMQASHSDDSFFSVERQGQTTVVPNMMPTMDVKFVVPHEFYEKF